MTIYFLGWAFFGTALATASEYTRTEEITTWMQISAFLVFTIAWPWILMTWIFQVLILVGRKNA